MIHGIHQTILTLLAVLIFYTQDIYFISRFESKRKAKGGTRSYRFTFLVGILVTCMAVQPIFAPWLSILLRAPAGLALQIAGLVLILAAVCLHIWARCHLRQFYAERVELQRLHWLVDTGPYALVRHPIFISFYLFAFGLLLINPGLVTLFVLIAAFWYFTRSAKKEEALLSQKVNGYREYLQHVPPYFPRLNRAKASRRLETRQ